MLVSGRVGCFEDWFDLIFSLILFQCGLGLDDSNGIYLSMVNTKNTNGDVWSAPVLGLYDVHWTLLTSFDVWCHNQQVQLELTSLQSRTHGWINDTMQLLDKRLIRVLRDWPGTLFLPLYQRDLLRCVRWKHHWPTGVWGTFVHQ